jgi:hypothetical protein
MILAVMARFDSHGAQQIPVIRMKSPRRSGFATAAIRRAIHAKSLISLSRLGYPAARPWKRTILPLPTRIRRDHL